MKDLDNLCINCFKELTEGAVCAECGYDNDTEVDFVYLAPKTILNDKYVVGAVQFHESDSVTYAGYDMQLDKKIFIREFYPKGIASRLEGNNVLHIRQKYMGTIDEYKKSFYTLWTTLEKMHSLSAVVPVYDVFEENATVYVIIEAMDSIPLREYLVRNEEGFIAWDNARLMFMPVLTTIEALHENGIIHGSITPDSLVLCRDGKVRLKPFCIQQSTDATSDLEFVNNSGYTAIEQYDNAHAICPATDIYAFSACIYRALVGTNPPDALSREANDKLMIPNSIAEKIPMHVIKALGSGLQIYPEKRIKSVSDFRELLDAAPSVKARAQAADAYSSEIDKNTYVDYSKLDEAQNKRTRIAVIVLSILVILAIAAGIYVVKFTNLLTPSNTATTATTQLQQFQVPNIANNGYTQEDVQNNGAWNQQFTITFAEDYSKNAKKGIIFKQSIKAGETVDQGTELILTVSKGIQTQEVPDVADKTADEAKKILEGLGFKVSTVEVYNDGTHTPNTVKSTYGTAPQKGETVAVGEEIIVQVYGEVQTTQSSSDTSTTSSDDNNE